MRIYNQVTIHNNCFFKNLLLLHEELSRQYINSVNDAGRYWMKKSLVEGIDIFSSGKYFPITNQSEADIMGRIWSMIPQAFDQGDIVARRYIYIYILYLNFRSSNTYIILGK